MIRKAPTARMEPYDHARKENRLRMVNGRDADDAAAQLSAVRAKADADTSTFERLKAAAATPGVIAGNELLQAQMGVESDQGQVAAAQQNVEAARQVLSSVTHMEEYLKVTAPFDG